MLTARESAADLLRFLSIGQRSIPPDGIEDDPLPHVLNAQNQALAECGTLGPIFHFRARRSGLIRATVTLAAGESWILGCSIKFTGEPWNEIIAWNNATKVATLLNPFISAGSGSGTVYCDSVAVDSDVLQVLEPVAIADGKPLVAVSNLNAIHSGQYQYWRDDDYARGRTLTTASRDTSILDHPNAYWIDSMWRVSGAPAKRFRLAPMPAVAAVLNYRARIQPPVLVTADIYDEGDPDEDPGTEIPFDDALARSVFQPIARQIFTGSPMFKSAEAKKEIAAGYEKAYAIAQRMNPQAAGGFRIGPGF
jgi:hypothetical protein